MTHAEWSAGIKRALKLADSQPTSARRLLHTLVRAIEASRKKGLHEWHLAQTLHIMSLVQAAAGDHRGSAETLVRLTKEHESQLNYEARAYVAACAAAALQLAQNGNPGAARRTLAKAGRWSRLLRPKDKLLDMANKTVAVLAARTRQRGTAG